MCSHKQMNAVLMCSVIYSNAVCNTHSSTRFRCAFCCVPLSKQTLLRRFPDASQTLLRHFSDFNEGTHDFLLRDVCFRIACFIVDQHSFLYLFNDFVSRMRSCNATVRTESCSVLRSIWIRMSVQGTARRLQRRRRTLQPLTHHTSFMQAI